MRLNFVIFAGFDQFKRLKIDVYFELCAFVFFFVCGVCSNVCRGGFFVRFENVA